MGVRLSEESWIAVEAAYRTGISAKVLSKRYGVSSSSIHRRSSREKWRNIPVRAAALTQAERLEQAVDRLETIMQRMSEAST
jgi:uncharacterized protein YjcR